MSLDNSIELAVSSVLKNPILGVLREINISKILLQSNFIKRDIGFSPFQIILHFIYMLVMNKRQSAFVKQSADSYGKDAYYRFVKDARYNWRKLLMLTSIALIRKIKPLQKDGDHRLLIIDDTVESKRGKLIEGSCRSIYSNKEHRCVNGINIVSLNYTDTHSTFQLDFSLRLNDSRRREVADFTSILHHKSNAHKRRIEGLNGKNIMALDMVKRAVNQGVEADYLLVDSWYAKPDFIGHAGELGMPVIARIANNIRIWNFNGEHKTLDSLHHALKAERRIHTGHYGKIRYTYFDAVVEHVKLGKVKLVFLRTAKELLVFISTHLVLSGKEIIDIYKKRWNIEQGFKDLREYFGLGREENRLYEALIARITLSMFTYNLLSYINRIKHEP
ncbi:MAG: transposase, partial [Sulfuricurvum sp.]|uniref:IS4 family transposase n=1 Tax=Sulfuricurvum sp. TaxID=2025608 RepID=UPI00356204CF